MIELTAAIVRFEVLGEGLEEIVDLYNLQRSEEVIEDMEEEIERSNYPEEILGAIDESYLY